MPLDRRGRGSRRSGGEVDSIAWADRLASGVRRHGRGEFDGKHRKGRCRGAVSVREDGAVLVSVLTGGCGEAVGGVGCPDDVGPVRTAIGADLPLDRRGRGSRCRGGERRRRAGRNGGAGRVGRDNRARFRQRDAG